MTYDVTRAPHCGDCEVEAYIERMLLAEGLALALMDDVTVIAGRLAAAGVTINQVRADTVNRAVFWRAVYGPAYPSLVMG
jgi:hypothetical protein